MASNAFLKVDGVSGESQDSGHKGWIDVSGFDLGATQPGNMHVGNGGGAGKVHYDDLVIYTNVDRATPTLFQYAASGKHISKVELAIHKAGGENIEYLRLTLEDVLVTEARYEGDLRQSIVPVIYKFQAAKVLHKYWEQTDKGGKGAEVSAGWNIKENQSC
ncbi:Hcp family type VI secretion system effector [Serratia rhizosphaerae]|uniref:Type VI secretion system tube protein Hcp n=1 Tax=Serratia rhizosphaerae TaxID=2597702 RepID=A0ABX6GS43_9GAMM|nr:type VI secretion system tube protein Hcp [Serratia rhizosphaerae]QHA89083.1 type VI secretion system tube protein Hcp [Serratia rhizosphaerae]